MNANTSFRVKIIAAFAAIYVIWGSTYLAIHFAIATIPPLLMAGTRFVIAGSVLFLWSYLRGSELPSFSDFKKSALIGALLLLGGNGMVVLAERSVPSGLTALIIATEPLMIVLLDWFRRGGTRPTGRVAVGMLLGFAGVVYLIGPMHVSGDSTVDFWGAVLLMAASLSWASGSLYASRATIKTQPLMTSAIQMLVGGVLLLSVGSARGEMTGFSLAAVSSSSFFALCYLVVFGSLVGFTCYSWMLKVVKPSLASTYAYVNPVVAVFLGWLIAGEAFTSQTVIAAVIILTGVVLILSYKKDDDLKKDKVEVVGKGEPCLEV